MKKKKIKGLRLNKQTISNLNAESIIGGGTAFYCDPSKKCPPLASERYTCTVNSVYKSNCHLETCKSAGMCA